MKKLIIAALAACATITGAHASDLRYPLTYNFLMNMGGQSYFTCNYTTKSCENGHWWRTPHEQWRVFEQIDDSDRTTVLAHGACFNPSNTHWVCWNFDTGQYKEAISGRPDFDGVLTGPDIANWPLSIKVTPNGP
jgi:hypothetical protein